MGRVCSARGTTTVTVLLLTDSGAFAGTERHIVTLAEALQGTGECLASVGCPAGTPVARAAAEVGVAVVDVPRGTRGAIRVLRSIHRSAQFDVVHAHNGRTCLLNAVAARGTRTACVFTQHFLSPARVDRKGVRGWLSRRMGAWALRRMHYTIAISDAVCDAAMARGDAPSSGITTVLNGIDNPTFRDDVLSAGTTTSGQALRVSCVARLSPEKRVDVLIDAMAKLESLDVVASCDVYGGGQLEGALAARIRQAAAPVVLHGHRADVLDAVRDMDVFVSTSDIEAFGLAIVEAMALGKPVVAVDAGGPREIVVHGVTGLLVPPNNPVALAEAIASLARDPARRVAMGRAGRERFLLHFTAERMARETLAVYRAVLANHGRRA
jgi:L-malate glycosyltransferase